MCSTKLGFHTTLKLKNKKQVKWWKRVVEINAELGARPEGQHISPSDGPFTRKVIDIILADWHESQPYSPLGFHVYFGKDQVVLKTHDGDGDPDTLSRIVQLFMRDHGITEPWVFQYCFYTNHPHSDSYSGGCYCVDQKQIRTMNTEDISRYFLQGQKLKPTKI